MANIRSYHKKYLKQHIFLETADRELHNRSTFRDFTLINLVWLTKK